MKMRPHLLTIITASILGFSSSVLADIDVYGKLHLSADYVDNDFDRTTSTGIADTTLSSNSSNIGFKGEHSLNYGFKAKWKLESDIDLAGERDMLKARNRYIGMEHAYGTLIAGYHDTPVKMLGASVDLFADTLADRRNIIGSGNGSLTTDIRAKNCAMYTSPEFSGVQLRLMGSVGGDSDPTTDSQYLASASVTYHHELFDVGLAGEHQTLTEIEHDTVRIVANAKLSSFTLNALYDLMMSDSIDQLNRSSVGGGIAYSLLDTHFKAQMFYATDYENVDSSSAISYAVGVTQTFSKKLEMYFLVAHTKNSDNASYTLGGGGHGETFNGAGSGADVLGVSGGLSYSFE